MSEDRIYIAIDLKSFYASVECVERGLDPLKTHLVVADPSRTKKTICLAVSPSLKAYGIPGRARLFEVIQKVKEINTQRLRKTSNCSFVGESYDERELKASPLLSLSYITAPPRMARYIEYSTKIYSIYLKYIAPEDIHVYSIDEVFMDVTSYLSTYKLTAHELAAKIVHDVLNTTGITATVGIGTNLYLAKVAMDIVAKHINPDKDGVRIAELNELKYRHQLWTHRPITDFWRVGRGYAAKLEKHGIYTMGDIALCSLGKRTDYYNEELLYRLFGINAGLLIDHAWGWEPCTIDDIKSYKPDTNSIGSGQVLQCPYNFDKARLIIREMTDILVLDLVDKELMTNQIVLTVGFDTENLNNPEIRKMYKGAVTIDSYGRRVPKHAHGTVNLGKYTSSLKLISDAVIKLYDRIINKNLLIRRVNITANNVINEAAASQSVIYDQLDLLTDYNVLQQQRENEKKSIEHEKRVQQTIIDIKKKFGKNAIIRGFNLQEGATTIERNKQIGGHKA